MRIDSSTIGMESARSYKAYSFKVKRFTLEYRSGMLQSGQNALNTAVDSKAENAGDTDEGTGEATKQSVATLQDWQSRFRSARTGLSMRNSVSQTFMDIQQQTIRYIFDLLFSARKNRFDPWRDSGMEDNVPQDDAQNGMTDADSGYTVMQPRRLTASLKVFTYSQETFFEESESTSFSTMGTVRTADGREINFNVNVGMSRQFQEHYKEELGIASFTLCDPLVINLDTDVAQLEDQTFYFDIDGDGEKDEISRLGAGSGYLALDKNGDGVINDGSELFGTSSGNGFADLARYDEDGNGWIDENDPIWEKLKIWAKDENGRDVLYRLADKGVGAICLQNAATDFTQKASNGHTLGAVRSTGIFLYENGSVGTVQHVDVAKYEGKA